jgi:hypothetical protein
MGSSSCRSHLMFYSLSAGKSTSEKRTGEEFIYVHATLGQLSQFWPMSRHGRVIYCMEPLQEGRRLLDPCPSRC